MSSDATGILEGVWIVDSGPGHAVPATHCAEDEVAVSHNLRFETGVGDRDRPCLWINVDSAQADLIEARQEAAGDEPDLQRRAERRVVGRGLEDGANVDKGAVAGSW